jgi:hypothetical protein
MIVGAPPRKRRALHVAFGVGEDVLLSDPLPAPPAPPPPRAAVAPPRAAAPPPRAAAPPPRPASASPPKLPRDLCALGNQKAWTQALRHVTEARTRHTPLVVHGPVGCGKTMGVRSLCAAVGLRVLELDGVEAEDTAQLLNWVTRVRKMNVMQGATAVFLDDFESFTPDARRALGKALAKEDKAFAPVFVTCQNPRSPALKALEPLAKVRLFAPRSHEIIGWFSTRFPSVVREPAVASGDLRRVRHALEWRKAVGGKALDAPDVVFPNMFAATERLLTRRMEPHAWASRAEERDVALLQEYVAPTDCEAAAAAAEAFSCADVCRASRYETHDAYVPRLIVAHAARLYTRGKDVGALKPRPALDASTQPWDVPACLLTEDAA